MTIMTPIEGITAPAIPGTTPPPIPTKAFQAWDETPLLSWRRADGWSAANQRLFLEAIAEGHGVEAATMRVGLSAASAYAFRRTAKGAAFARLTSRRGSKSRVVGRAAGPAGRAAR